MAKNRGFSKILDRKVYFSKKKFARSFRALYCGSFEPSYSYVALPVEACLPDEQSGPTPALAPYRLLESGRPDQVSAGAHFSLA